MNVKANNAITVGSVMSSHPDGRKEKIDLSNSEATGQGSAKDIDFYSFELFETPPTIIEPASFNRHAEKPPYYLDRLRARGRWRSWHYTRANEDKSSYWYYPKKWCYSGTTGAIKPSVLPDDRGIAIDMGCGESPDALYAVEQFGFKHAIKVDLYDIRQADEHTGHGLQEAEKGKVTFIKGDVCERLPMTDNIAGLVMAHAMIDLIPKLDRSLFYREAYRLLKPGGILCISYVPLKAGYGWIPDEELQQLRDIGLVQLNRGRKSLIFRKQRHEQG